MLIEIGWLLMLAVGLTTWTVRDMRHFRQHRLIVDSGARCRLYLSWTVQSFVLLVGASLVSLWLVDALTAPFAFPAVFAPVHARLAPPAEMSGDALLGMVAGTAVSLTVGGVLQYRRIRSLFNAVPSELEPLIPRNGREMLAVVPLSLNAGFSEELFFRCALPLLLLHVTGSLAWSLTVSIAAFGLIHAYQGWKGIALTTLMGAVLTMMYLSSGSLLRVMAVHAAIDLVALIVRPALTRWIASWRAPHPA